MSAKKSVVLFYDVISPYSWLGFEGICRYQQKWDISLKLKPVLIGGLFQSTENSPPGLNKCKGKYLGQDLYRLGQYMEVPLRMPKDFVKTIINKGSLNAQRLLTASSLSKPDSLEALSRSLWLRVWSKDEDITEPGSLLEACQAAGLSSADAETLLKRTKDADVKSALKENTDEALARGAFGAPTFWVEDSSGTGHLVFGSDRFHIIAQFLGEKFDGPLNELGKTKF